jgi:hypothetical protein
MKIYNKLSCEFSITFALYQNKIIIKNSAEIYVTQCRTECSGTEGLGLNSASLLQKYFFSFSLAIKKLPRHFTYYMLDSPFRKKNYGMQSLSMARRRGRGVCHIWFGRLCGMVHRPYIGSVPL